VTNDNHPLQLQSGDKGLNVGGVSLNGRSAWWVRLGVTGQVERVDRRIGQKAHFVGPVGVSSTSPVNQHQRWSPGRACLNRIKHSLTV
jgi:hypothetical protein